MKASVPHTQQQPEPDYWVCGLTDKPANASDRRGPHNDLSTPLTTSSAGG